MADLTIYNREGREFRVHLVEPGARYGRHDKLVHKGDDALVEFYDMTHRDKFDGVGQFVARYYTRTIANPQSGLALDCGVPEWSIDFTAMKMVDRWVEAQLGPADVEASS